MSVGLEKFCETSPGFFSALSLSLFLYAVSPGFAAHIEKANKNLWN